MQKFIKFNFKKKDNRIIFAGYMIGKDNKERLVIGESECSLFDQFDSAIGKLIAVRKSLGLKIDDVCEIIESKQTPFSDKIKGSWIGGYTVVPM